MSYKPPEAQKCQRTSNRMYNVKQTQKQQRGIKHVNRNKPTDIVRVRLAEKMIRLVSDVVVVVRHKPVINLVFIEEPVTVLVQLLTKLLLVLGTPARLRIRLIIFIFFIRHVV